jgi:hypothetical protein
MRCSVDRRGFKTRTLPSVLTPYGCDRIEYATSAGDPRTFGLAFVGSARPLNGHTFDDGATIPNYIVPSGTLEVWRFTNLAGGMMTTAHPMHVHSPKCLLRSWTVARTQAAAYATMSQGLVEPGWKDTVIEMPG